MAQPQAAGDVPTRGQVQASAAARASGPAKADPNGQGGAEEAEAARPGEVTSALPECQVRARGSADPGSHPRRQVCSTASSTGRRGQEREEVKQPSSLLVMRRQER